MLVTLASTVDHVVTYTYWETYTPGSRSGTCATVLPNSNRFLGDRFWRPFVKRSPYTIGPLCCLSCVSCPVCLSVTLVCCGQTVGWIKMKRGIEVGLGLCHTVLDGDSAPPKGHSPQFSARVRCGQTAGCIRIPLCTEVGLGPDNIVFDGDPALPHGKGHRSPTTFRPMFVVAKRLDGLRCHLVWI